MTDVLASIDHALAVQDATAYGDAGWLPGDPLFSDPRHAVARGDFDVQCVRPMLHVIDADPLYVARCEPCQVSWHGDEPCWMCSTERPRPTLRGSTSYAEVWDEDDTVTRRGFFGELTLSRPRYPRPDTRLDNQENR